MSIDLEKNNNNQTFEFMNQEILKSKAIEESIPCDNCNGDCCGPVVFTLKELDSIFDKYQKRKAFKKRFPWNEFTIGQHMLFRQAFPGQNKDIVIASFKKKVYYTKRGLNPDSCIFKDNEETGGCMIYEDRPLVCREYGNRECLKCPYTGLDKQPEDLEVRKQLVIAGHKYRNNQLLIEQQAYLKFNIQGSK